MRDGQPVVWVEGCEIPQKVKSVRLSEQKRWYRHVNKLEQLECPILMLLKVLYGSAKGSPLLCRVPSVRNQRDDRQLAAMPW